MKSTMKSELPEMIVSVRSVFSRLSVAVPHGSAVGRRLDALGRFHEASAPFTALEPAFFRLVGECLWLADIVAELDQRLDLKPHLKKLLSESDFHDKFIELLVATHLFRAGYVVEDKEPDWIVVLGGDKIAIACKRVSSTKALLKRLGEARNQIERSGCPGIIIMDIGSLPENPTTIEGTSEGHALQQIMSVSRAIVEPVRWEVSTSLKAAASVYGVLFHNGQNVFIQTGVNHETKTVSFMGATLNHYGGVWVQNDRVVDELLDRLERRVEM